MDVPPEERRLPDPTTETVTTKEGLSFPRIDPIDPDVETSIEIVRSCRCRHSGVVITLDDRKTDAVLAVTHPIQTIHVANGAEAALDGLSSHGLLGPQNHPSRMGRLLPVDRTTVEVCNLHRVVLEAVNHQSSSMSSPSSSRSSSPVGKGASRLGFPASSSVRPKCGSGIDPGSGGRLCSLSLMCSPLPQLSIARSTFCEEPGKLFFVSVVYGVVCLE